MTTKSNNNTETKSVAMQPQVSNDQTVDISVGEVSIDDIKPRVVKAAVESANGGKATTLPLGKHGSIVIAGVGGTKKKTTDSTEAKTTTDSTDKVQDSVPPAPSKPTQPISPSKPKATLTFSIYTTEDGKEIPQIMGFGGETDARWKTHYDERQRLMKAAAEAKKKNEKLREQIKAQTKAKTKEEKTAIKERLMKKWVHTTSDPFGANCYTDRTTGEKRYYFSLGVKYMDVARELCDAYNSGDAGRIAAAEQAVRDRRAAINAEYQAEREAREAEKKTTTESTDKPAAPAMDANEQAMFELFKKFMAGDKEAMAQVAQAIAPAA